MRDVRCRPISWHRVQSEAGNGKAIGSICPGLDKCPD